MREWFAAATLALLLATAGCSTFGGGGDVSLSPEERPPGVADNGTLVDETALLDAHTERVIASGGVWDIRTNATVYQRDRYRQVARQQQVFVEPDATEYGYVLQNPGSSFQAWGNTSVEVVQANLGEQTRYQVGEPATNATLVGRPVLAQQLPEGALEVTHVNRSGDLTLVTLETTDPPAGDGPFPPNATNVRDYQARLVLDAQGRIHTFEASATYTLRGEEGSSYFRYELVQTSPPPLQQPDWVSEALTRSDS